MKESSPEFEKYQETFPSDDILEKLFGRKDQFLARTWRYWNWLLLCRGPMSVFNDVSLSKALDSGLLRRSWNPLRLFRSFPFVIDKQRFCEEYDAFAEKRKEFDSLLRLSATLRIRHIEWGNVNKIPGPQFIFQKGKVNELLRGRLGKCSSDIETELCREFISQCKAGALHEDPWWCWAVEGDSIWIEVIPKALDSFRKDREEKHKKAREGFKRAVCTPIFK